MNADSTTFRFEDVEQSDASGLLSSVELVYQRTRKAIMAGTLAPGEALKNQELADRHGVSMIPVREALRLLESEGFVEIIPNRGARVSPLSRDDMVDLCGIRIVLEVEAMRLAFPQITNLHCSDGRQLIDQLYEQEELKSSQVQKINRQFHFLFYSLSESQWLLRMIDSVWDHTDRYRLQIASRVNPDSSREQHLRIIEAIETEGQAATLAALREHLEGSRDLLMEMYSTSAPNEGSDNGL